MTSGGLAFIQQWYLDQCDTFWEHQFGVDITFSASDGWRIAVDVAETPLEGHLLPTSRFVGDALEIATCSSEGSKFTAYAGYKSLCAALEVFETWVRLADSVLSRVAVAERPSVLRLGIGGKLSCKPTDSAALFLENWSLAWLGQRQKRTEQPTDSDERCIRIGTLDNPGWTLDFDLYGTPLRGRMASRHKESYETEDWLVGWCDGNTYCVDGGPLTLISAIHLFREWVLTDENLVRIRGVPI